MVWQQMFHLPKEIYEQIVIAIRQANVMENPVVPVFRYIHKFGKKDDESLFSECTNPKSTIKVERKFNEASWHVLKEKGVLPAHKGNPSKLTNVPFPGFVTSSKRSLQEESYLPKNVHQRRI